MKRVDGVVGNVEDSPEIADEVDDHETNGTLETVVLDDTERKRSRLRVTTDAGTDLGVLVDTPELTTGDVLVLNDDRAVVVASERRDAFVIEFPAAETAVSTGVELGHRIGNQHWDIAVENRRIYVPVDADRTIIENVLGPYIPEAATTRYETVDAERFVDGDDSDASYAYDDHAADHSHDHHDHSRDNDDGDEHTHDHSHQGSPTAPTSERDTR